MSGIRRIASVLIVLAVLFGGCGDDEEDDSSPTTAFVPSATTAVSGGPTSAPSQSTVVAGVAQGATDGAPCPTVGARGTTRDGIALVCAVIGGDTRWRPA
jgi:hypothetical protein